MKVVNSMRQLGRLVNYISLSRVTCLPHLPSQVRERSITTFFDDFLNIIKLVSGVMTDAQGYLHSILDIM